MPHVLIVGVSVRAAAVSASRAGYDVTAIDAFGDIDVPSAVCFLPFASGSASANPRFSALAAARAARGVTCDAVAYGSGFENHPRAVAALARGRVLWGNSPDVLDRVRCPRQFLAAFHRKGFRVPDTLESRAPGEPGDSAAAFVEASSGEIGSRSRSVRVVDRVYACGNREYRSPEARICRLASTAHPAPSSSSPLAATRCRWACRVSSWEIPAFGAAGFRYCGSILSRTGDLFGHDETVIATAWSLARAAARDHGLVGVNGIDFVARDGVPYPIEINPRWSASMELVERADGTSVFAAHAAACTDGVLSAPASRVPEPPTLGKPVVGKALGKAIVFARRATVARGTRAWLERDDVSDVPAPGTSIPSGAPVCTVFAEGESAAACYAALVRRAEDVYSEIGSW